jgi:uncharacterized protein YbaA (DUF1428 family)
MAAAKVRYVDGFVLVVKKSKLAAYRKMAQAAFRGWKKYGALDYKECVADDMKVPMVSLTFPKLTKLKKGEVVLFSYIGYRSKAERDRVNKRVMQDWMNDPKYKNMKMPFDPKRVTMGGFKVLVG